MYIYITINNYNYIYKITRRWHKHPTCEDGICLFNIFWGFHKCHLLVCSIIQKLDQKTNLHQNGMPTVRVRTFFSQKDRNAVRPETIIYIHTILAEYLEYSDFQPYGCEQKKYLEYLK